MWLEHPIRIGFNILLRCCRYSLGFGIMVFVMLRRGTGGAHGQAVAVVFSFLQVDDYVTVYWL
jgi:hypothetical protein